MMPSRAKLLILLLVSTLLISYLRSRWSSSILPTTGSKAANHHVSLATAALSPANHGPHSSFWKAFQPLLDAYPPGIDGPLVPDEKAGARGFNPTDEESERADLIRMNESDVESMRAAHAGFVAEIESGDIAPHYVPGSRGVVSTAGGKYLPVLVISLRMLRATGSTLPVEVFLASDEEYESEICDVVLRDLNAKCVILSHIFSNAESKKEIAHYQYKPFALLFSSFDEILFLDADAFPISDPDVLFDSDPFTSFGMVTWPDFWRSTVSKHYYSISAQPLPRTTTERASTESGEILLSKSTHAKSLMLATYYNYHGPGFYYPLLSQGAPGEGDKETFLTAASALAEPFYPVSEPLSAIGHVKPESRGGGMAGSAMLQYDPREDFGLTTKGLWRVKEQSVAPRPKPFFIHANFPKFNPASVFDERHEVQPTREYEENGGGWVRAWIVPEDVVALLRGEEGEEGEEREGEEEKEEKIVDVDVEKRFWTEIRAVACELENKFRSWEGEEGICERVEGYVKEVFGI